MPKTALLLYLREIRRTRPLDREEELRLFHRVSEGDIAARDLLIVSNLRFVLGIAMRYRNPCLPLPDLVNEGCLGLIRAVESFEADRGIRFLSYAVWWIRASMSRALDRTGSIVRVPGRFAAQGRPGAEASDQSGAAPRAGEANRIVSFEDGMALTANPECAWGTSSLEDQAEDVISPLSTGLLAKLPEREAQVLRYLYSLDHRPTQSLREVALSLGISHQRVCQLRDQAFNRLRVHARFLLSRKHRFLSHPGIDPTNFPNLHMPGI